jgi:hypothetical protein
LIGTSGPIDAGGNGPQRAKQASRMSFGREGVICEYIEIMQIPPRFERRRAAYKSIAGVLQYGGAAERPAQNWKYKNSSRCHMPNSEIASASAVTSAHTPLGRHRSKLAFSGAWRYSR